MRISLFLILFSLSLLFLSIDAAFPSVDFTGLLRTYATSTSTDNTWCKKCPAFSNPPCAMGCAGDAGGGPCPPEACPRAYTFPLVNNQPIWNVQVATAGDPYRAFSYIPLCTQAGQCTESFIFSFSVKFTPAGANAAQTSNFFSQQRDYLKLLFWGDGNNILGVKNGQLLGFPNGGSADLVGTNGIGSGHAFAAPFSRDVWTHIGVQFNVNNGRTSLAFFLNGVSIGSTDKTIGIQNSGLQFGAYVWNGAFFTLQYKDIAITKTLPIISNGATATTATPTTKAPTPTPTVTPKPTQAATPRPVVTAVPPAVSATTAPPTSPPVTQGFPNIDFTSLLQKYATSTDGTWCTKCSPNFQQPTQSTCSMGCAGDTGGGGACPASACPRLFTFPIVNNEPIWNINVQTAGDPYRAFSYIPICTQAGQCTESFFFSFSFKYIPDASTSTSAQTEFFSQQRDYLKMLFWGDGNNILGVKNGQLLGFPNGGIVDLVGTNGIGSGHAFATPFISDVWTHVGIQFNVQNGRTSLAFFLNGIATGTTTGEVGVSQFGLQFGAYVWNGATFTLQYKDITITKNLPTIGGTTPIPATPTVTEQPPLDDTTDPPTSTDPDTPSTIATSKPTSLPTNSGPSMAIYDTATVARHNQASDCWTILDGIVFDISKLVFIHPGGIQIKSYCGKDCSIIFSASHTNDAADRALLAKSYLKGTLGSMTTSKPTNPTVINVGDSRYNQATTITSSLLCMMISLIVAVVLEYLI